MGYGQGEATAVQWPRSWASPPHTRTSCGGTPSIFLEASRYMIWTRVPPLVFSPLAGSRRASASSDQVGVAAHQDLGGTHALQCVGGDQHRVRLIGAEAVPGGP